MSVTTTTTAAAGLEEVILDAIRGGNLTWVSRGGGGTSYRLWSTEHDYRVLVGAERQALRRLIAAGRVRPFRGSRHNHGGFQVRP
jgi:hypothetical protein